MSEENRSVMLRIVGTQIVNGEEDPDSKIEFVTEGTYRREGDTRYLAYKETELSGMEGCTTYLTVEPAHIHMSRRGGDVVQDTIMDFEQGKRFTDVYHTPYGDINMELLTNSIEAGEERIHIDYNISLVGMGNTRNRLDIEIM